MPEHLIHQRTQQMAQFAFDKVEEAKEELQDKASEFKAYVKKIPLMIRANGLTATFAFVFSKRKTGRDKNAYCLIQEFVEEWLTERNILRLRKGQQLPDALARLDRDVYRRVIRELNALFNWFKRFADGLIEKKGGI